jgi:hypothetical protein
VGDPELRPAANLLNSVGKGAKSAFPASNLFDCLIGVLGAELLRDHHPVQGFQAAEYEIESILEILDAYLLSPRFCGLRSDFWWVICIGVVAVAAMAIAVVEMQKPRSPLAPWFLIHAVASLSVVAVVFSLPDARAIAAAA